MTDAAKDLTDDDLRQFSDFMAKLPAPKPPQDSPDAARMERGPRSPSYHCGFCHNPDFSGRDNVPRLAAQREDYLVKALREYKSNTRPGYDASMAEVTQPISDAEILRSRVFYGAGAMKKQGGLIRCPKSGDQHFRMWHETDQPGRPVDVRCSR